MIFSCFSICKILTDQFPFQCIQAFLAKLADRSLIFYNWISHRAWSPYGCNTINKEQATCSKKLGNTANLTSTQNFQSGPKQNYIDDNQKEWSFELKTVTLTLTLRKSEDLRFSIIWRKTFQQFPHNLWSYIVLKITSSLKSAHLTDSDLTFMYNFCFVPLQLGSILNKYYAYNFL